MKKGRREKRKLDEEREGRGEAEKRAIGVICATWRKAQRNDNFSRKANPIRKKDVTKRQKEF